ncbi:uncharacterized protein LOC141534225 isoform X3 [Cotesia typhae]|uniref:uncharacterized protein LOC141534225 isoform X3 n=1 Tax=Cotesia typhae TaxID=2053667 RepID=UPI003D68C8AE
MNADVLLDLGGKNVDVRWRSIKFSTFVLQREMLLMNLDLLIFSTKVAEFITGGMSKCETNKLESTLNVADR